MSHAADIAEILANHCTPMTEWTERTSNLRNTGYQYIPLGDSKGIAVRWCTGNRCTREVHRQLAMSHEPKYNTPWFGRSR